MNIVFAKHSLALHLNKILRERKLHFPRNKAKKALAIAILVLMTASAVFLTVNTPVEAQALPHNQSVDHYQLALLQTSQLLQ